MLYDPDLPRCEWPGKPETSTLMITRQDTERGVPLHDDRKHFELLVLDAMNKALRAQGFRFTGSTICYAGLVNDHVTDCFRHAPLRTTAA